MVSRYSTVYNFVNSLFLLIIIKSGLLAVIRWSVCMSNPIGAYMNDFLGQILGCAYTICWSNFNSLHISQWITLYTHINFIITIVILYFMHVFRPDLLGIYEWQKVSSTFVSIVAFIYSTVVLMFSSRFSSFFSKLLGTITRAPTTIRITVTFMYYSFLALSEDPSIRLSFGFSLFLLYGLLEW